MANLKLEIMQESPFSSIQEEALLNLMRSSDAVHRAFQRKTRDWGVTVTQYNVLRILRGVHPLGHARCEIACRMLDRAPDAGQYSRSDRGRLNGYANRRVR